MSWLFGSRNPPPSPAGFPPPPGGSDGGGDKMDGRMEYSLDSSALERAARAAKELESSKHAKDALLLIQEQERTKACEAQKEIKEYKALVEQLKLDQLRASGEEWRKNIAEETKQHQYKAQYDDQLARKRFDDELAQQARMLKENLRNKEEFVKKQEAMRIATIEKEAELRLKHDMMKIEAKRRGQAKFERENWDIIKEQIHLKAAEERKTKLESILTTGQVIRSGLTNFLNNWNMITAFAGGATLVVGGYYGVKHSFGLPFRMLEARLGKPSLIQESSRLSIKHPIKTIAQLVKKPEDPMKGIILKPSLDRKLRDIAIEIKNTKKNKGYFRNILLYGPPGTGKTMFAKGLAKHSGMDYAIMSGGNVLPMKEEGVTALRKVFDWARTSRKGLVLFIDEADAFLHQRVSESINDSMRSSSLYAFLEATGEQSDKFMLVLASNQLEGFDQAVNDRIDEMVKFDLPGYEERERLVKQYFQQLILEPAVSKSRLQVAQFDYGAKCANVAKLTEGMSGREISKIVFAWQTTRAFLPAMIAHNKGHVAVGSVLGLMGLNGAADYCSSKFGTDGFMDALRDELRYTGVSGVTLFTVYPYHVDNEMFAGATTRFPKLFPAINENYLAKRIVDAVLSGQERMIVPRLLYLSAIFYRIAPVAAITAVMKFICGHEVVENMKHHGHIHS